MTLKQEAIERVRAYVDAYPHCDDDTVIDIGAVHAASPTFSDHRLLLLSAACEPGEEWIPISQKPHRPLAAILSFGNRKWTDQDGNPTELGHPRDHAENMDIACWDGEAWVEQYTGHDVLEDWKDASEMPTHWCPLPVPPAAISAFGGGV